ncbi:MAG TPA: hypothetical protein PKY08_00630 [Candidatus Magasanikbacteria bacterium]|nr:hypothetical protein [Candidatus Magasanikbacteria bacterium]
MSCATWVSRTRRILETNGYKPIFIQGIFNSNGVKKILAFCQCQDQKETVCVSLDTDAEWTPLSPLAIVTTSVKRGRGDWKTAMETLVQDEFPQFNLHWCFQKSRPKVGKPGQEFDIDFQNSLSKSHIPQRRDEDGNLFDSYIQGEVTR